MTDMQNSLDQSFEKHGLDWTQMARYLAGHAGPDETLRIRGWLAADRERRKELEFLRAIWRESERQELASSGVTPVAIAARLRARAAADDVAEDEGRGRGRGGRRPSTPRDSGGRRFPWPILWLTSAVAGGFLLFSRSSHDAPRAHPRTRTYSTGVSQEAILRLDDGSRITLAPRTTLRVAGFDPHSRTVVLDDGEAYFDVAHAAGVPFLVQSGAATTRVLGTTFHVRHHAGESRVRVAVIDGRVLVTSPGGNHSGVTLNAGNVGDITDSTAQVNAMDDMAPGNELRDGQYVFRDMPMFAVFQMMTRWYGYQFRYADSTLPQRNVTIGISARSSAVALAKIEQVLRVNMTVRGDTVILTPQSGATKRGSPPIRTYNAWVPAREVGK